VRVAITTVAIVSIGLSSQVRHPAASPPGLLTIDQLVDIKHPSNAIWSRDSRRVAFIWERAGVQNLYVVPADGSAAPVAMTTDGQPVGNIFWSSDSQRLYFMRGATLMQAAIGGGEARPALTNFSGRSLSISRDGTRIAYLLGGGGGRGGGRGRTPSGDAAQAPVVQAPTEIRVRVLADGADALVATMNESVSGVTWVDDRLLSVTVGGAGQIIRHEQTPEYSGAKIIYTITERVAGPAADSYIVPATGGAAVKYNGGGGGFGRGGNRWLDSTRFLVDRPSSDFKRRSIFVGDTKGGEPKLVHEDVKTTFWSMTGDARGGSQPSPDGKWISFLSDRDGWDHLYVMPSGGGTPIQITRGAFEAWRPSWSPDGTRIVFDSNEGDNPGSRHLGIASINGDPGHATVRMVTHGRGTDVDAQWAPDGRSLVYQHTDPHNSADLYALDVTKADAKPVRLTDSMPSSIDRSALVQPQLVHYPGPDGTPVPAYLFVSKNLDRAQKHPAVVWIHGDGVNQNYDGWHVQRNYAVYYSFHQYLLQRGYVVLAPDYRGSIGYGSAWREGVYMDVGGKDFRDAALSATYLKSLPYVDGDRIGVWGLSYGGFFTLLAVTEMPTTFRAAVDVAGVADYAMYYEDPYHGGWTVSRIGTPEQNPAVYAQASPLSHMDRLVRPLLILHGTADVNVPYLHSVRLIDELLKHDKGSLVEFMTYPGEFHYFTREHVLRDAWERVERFFERWLKAEPIPAS
jgi:dipeptidyl aminopeptidase/acylaminoacyl peptidase